VLRVTSNLRPWLAWSAGRLVNDTQKTRAAYALLEMRQESGGGCGSREAQAARDTEQFALNNSNATYRMH
jgi:hypothetical protein